MSFGSIIAMMNSMHKVGRLCAAGTDMDAFIYDCEWKQKFKELNEFLLKFCELKLKEKYFNKR